MERLQIIFQDYWSRFICKYTFEEHVFYLSTLSLCFCKMRWISVQKYTEGPLYFHLSWIWTGKKCFDCFCRSAGDQRAGGAQGSGGAAGEAAEGDAGQSAAPAWRRRVEQRAGAQVRTDTGVTDDRRVCNVEDTLFFPGCSGSGQSWSRTLPERSVTWSRDWVPRRISWRPSSDWRWTRRWCWSGGCGPHKTDWRSVVVSFSTLLV